jgi:hypothetical protein
MYWPLIAATKCDQIRFELCALATGALTRVRRVNLRILPFSVSADSKAVHQICRRLNAIHSAPCRAVIAHGHAERHFVRHGEQIEGEGEARDHVIQNWPPRTEAHVEDLDVLPAPQFQ